MGRDVVKETTDDNFYVPVIVDGWKAYLSLTIIQRSEAHLIRELDAFTNTDHGKKLSDEIRSMFGELRESLKLDHVNERKSMKNLFDKRM